MTKLTSNIGLTKPLESDFVDLGILNENLDIIDQTIGPMNNVPTASKSAAGAISEIADNLSSKEPQQLVLSNGTQIVDGGDVPAVIHPTMQGRTLINLLGRDGNCEDTSRWSSVNASLLLDTTNRVYGQSSILANGTAAVGIGLRTNYTKPINIDNTKHYYIQAWFYNVSCDYFSLLMLEATSAITVLKNTVEYTTKGKFVRVGLKVAPEDFEGNTAICVYPRGQASAVGQQMYVDGVSMYQITASEYDALDSMTEAQIIAKYPYVDDMKHVNAVYIENKGNNLLPPFSEWILHSEVVVESAYRLTLQATGTGRISSVAVPSLPSTTYTFSASHSARIRIVSINSNNVETDLQGTTGREEVTFTTMPDTKKLLIMFTSGVLGAGTYTFSNPMLNIGSEPLPFEPQKPSYLYLPDCNLRSNVDGSVADRLYTDGQGKPRVTRRFREVHGESVGWVFHYDMPGFKAVKFPRPADLLSYQTTTVINFNGSYISSTGNITNGANLFTVDATHFYLSISDIDSGWGESYTPTADEIKAYFYGWKMYPASGSSTDLYTGSGNRAWTPIQSYNGSSYLGWFTGNTTPPANFPNSANVTGGYRVSRQVTPYRLMYQLTQSVDEAVTYEGSFMLHEGDNQVEVGTGIVVREAANPVIVSGGSFAINAGNSSAHMKNRVKSFLDINRNSLRDSWELNLTESVSKFGEVYARIRGSSYDPTAAYSVTYLALDTYTLGIAPQTINAEYAPNIRESIESLVREVVEARTETSVLQNTKAQKQPIQWINATLLAEWTGSISYRKNETGQLEIAISATPGTIAGLTMIARLPEGYRPTRTTSLKVINNNTGAMVNGELYITRAGSIVVALESTLGTTQYQGSYVIPLQ